MNNKAEIVNWNGMPCIQLTAGGYTALIANEIGSNVIRLHDDKNGIEFFRYNSDNTSDTIKNSAEVWGLPTLYLPNRFADGVLKTSDAVYQLPVNEKAPFNNHIHGFLHKRCHKITELTSNIDAAWAKTSYEYDESDPFFESLPIKFRADFMFVLSANGLEYTVSFTNLSDKMMPISLATHTTINSPFVDGAKEEDCRIAVPATEKWILNERCLPTGEILPLNDYDKSYVDGTMCPVLKDISNDMYSGTKQNLHGAPFRGVVMTDTASGKGIGYEVSSDYKFWIIWNDHGNNHYFCPEPMTAMIDAPNMNMPFEKTGYQEIAPNQIFTASQHFFSII